MLSRATASLPRQNALLGQLPAVPSYLGQVATGCLLPTNTGTPKQLNSRSPHFARDSITALKIVLPGFYMSGSAAGELTTGANTTYTASIEYPAGTYTQVLFGGAASGTATDGGMLTSDVVSVAIPKGALFWVRVFAQNSTAVPIRFSGLNTGCGALLSYGSSGLSDLTMGGTITNSGSVVPGGLTSGPSAVFFSPVAILAQTTQRSFYLLGDSRCTGRNDAFFGANCDQGNLARSIGPFAAYINGGVGGDTLAGFIASHTNRLILAGYCSDVVLQLTINDVFAGTSVATMQGYHTTIRGYFPAGTNVYLTTSEPVSSSTAVAISSLTSSGTLCTATVAATAALSVGQLVTVAGASPTTYNGTVQITSIPSATTFTYNVASAPASSPATGTITYQDCWTQVSSQTTNTGNASRVAMNNWKRAVPTGFKGCLELADVVEAGRDSGLWTSQFGSATADGTHSWSSTYLAIKASGAITATALV